MHVSTAAGFSPVQSITNILQSTAAAPPSEAPACGCETLTPQEHLDDCTYAFTGTVFEATKPKNGQRLISFDVNEVFKGSPTEEMKIMVDVIGDMCDFPFELDQSYLVFAKWEWGRVVTTRCMGTKLLPKVPLTELGPSEQLKEKLYIRLRNACMGRLDTPCCLNSLKALRAGFYLPEPDDGCPSGTIPDRLHCNGSYTWCIPVLEKSHQ